MSAAKTSLEVRAAVEQAYARFERKASTWLSGYAERGGQVYCAAGCVACCNMPVRVSLAEALLVAQALTPAQAAQVEAHARQVMRNARTAPDEETYVMRHRLEVGFCPLLDRSSGRCTQYAVRPTRCRDTYSAFPAHYCEAGTWEAMSRREQAEYRRQVERTPGTDGEWHYLAPLEHLSEPVWQAASRAMQRAWNLEVWGDFWVLTTLAAHPEFMQAVAAGQPDLAWKVAAKQKLAHDLLLDIIPAGR